MKKTAMVILVGLVLSLCLCFPALAEEGVLNLPGILTDIEAEAFAGLETVQQVNIPKTVKKIGAGAFRGCGDPSKPTRSYLAPEGVAVGEGALDGVSARLFYDGQELPYLTYKVEGNEVTITGTSDNEIQSITIPAVIEGKPVTTIGAEAFAKYGNLTSVTIPEGVTTIERWAFQSCAKLTEVSFPSTLTTIKADAFNGACTVEGTHIFYLPDGLTGDAYAFNNGFLGVLSVKRGSSSESYIRSTMGAYYTHHGETDFRYRYHSDEGERLMEYKGSAAESVEIPAYVWLIDNDAFKDHTELKHVVIPEGVTKINHNAFTGCVKLTDVTFPASLTTIEAQAFQKCGSAAEEPFRYDLPDGITFVQNNTFSDCPAVLVCSLESKTAETISDKGYSYARKDREGELDIRYKYGYQNNAKVPKLYDYVGTEKRVRVPDDCPGADREKLRDRTDLTLICAQCSMTADALSAAELNFSFPDHEGLLYRVIDGVLNIMGWNGEGTEIIIPEATAYRNAGVEEHIREKAFSGLTTITKVVIPEGTTEIGDSAFLGCENLTDITFPDSLKVLKNHAFEGCGKASTTRHYYVLPDHMTEVSTNTDAGWGAFTDINMGVLICTVGSDTSKLISVGHRNAYSFAPRGHENDGLLYRYVRVGSAEPYEYRLYVWEYTGSAEEVTIPGDIGVYGVSAPPPGGSDTWKPAFYQNKKLKKIVIPEGVKEVEDSAFSGCTLLTDITLPSTLKRLANHAFENTGTAAQKRFIVVLPAGLQTITTSNGAGWASFNQSAATIVVQSAEIANQHYDDWWQYYDSLADAQSGDILRIKRKPKDTESREYNGNV